MAIMPTPLAVPDSKAADSSGAANVKALTVLDGFGLRSHAASKPGIITAEPSSPPGAAINPARAYGATHRPSEAVPAGATSSFRTSTTTGSPDTTTEPGGPSTHFDAFFGCSAASSGWSPPFLSRHELTPSSITAAA